jgi:hypothetical protein
MSRHHTCRARMCRSVVGRRQNVAMLTEGRSRCRGARGQRPRVRGAGPRASDGGHRGAGHGRTARRSTRRVADGHPARRRARCGTPSEARTARFPCGGGFTSSVADGPTGEATSAELSQRERTRKRSWERGRPGRPPAQLGGGSRLAAAVARLFTSWQSSSSPPSPQRITQAPSMRSMPPARKARCTNSAQQ